MNPLIIFVFLFADISALIIPEENTNPTVTRDPRVISDTISEAIQDASQTIKGSGLDPIYIKKKHVQISLPVPLIFNAHTCLKEIEIGGFSNIVIHKLSFSIFRSRFDFDIEMPLIYVYGSSTLRTTFFGKKFDVIASGNIEIHRIRFVGQIQFNALSGTIRNVTVKFTLGGINSGVNLIIQGKNYSSYVNYFIGTTIPITIAEYSAHFDELLAVILTDTINANL